MTYEEYWILDAVVEGRYALSTLREDVVEDAFNRKGHGLARSQLVETLATLFSKGDIIAEDEIDARQYSPSEKEIADAFVSSRWIWYGLTSQGGNKWELESRPNWERFITGSLDAEVNDCDVTSSNQGAIVNYLHNNEVRKRILPGSIIWRKMINWQATYWKFLSTGFEVHFQITDPNIDFMVAQPPADWYTNPFT